MTGANGFVGSRVAACLVSRGVPTTVLLRPGARRDRIESLLGAVEVRPGSLEDPAGLAAAVEGVTHVIHAAGKTKVVEVGEYEAVNVEGTRRLLQVVGATGGRVRRLVTLSSLAAVGPAVTERPAREDDPPHPVSAYGRSKLAAEELIRAACPCEFVILRPPGIYGPGDQDFLQLFRTVRWRVRPAFGFRPQPLSLAFVEDVAAVAVACLDLPAARGQTVHVAQAEPVTADELGREVARAMDVRAVPLRLPMVLLRWACAWEEAKARRTGTPGILNRDRCHELEAAGWVCDTRRLRRDLGLECGTPLREGIRRTLAWYRGQGWL